MEIHRDSSKKLLNIVSIFSIGRLAVKIEFMKYLIIIKFLIFLFPSKSFSSECQKGKQRFINIGTSIPFEIGLCLESDEEKKHLESTQVKLSEKEVALFKSNLQEIIDSLPNFMNQVYKNGFKQFVFIKPAREPKYRCENNPARSIILYQSKNCIGVGGSFVAARFLLSYDLIAMPSGFQDEYGGFNFLKHILIHELAHAFDSHLFENQQELKKKSPTFIPPAEDPDREAFGRGPYFSKGPEIFHISSMPEFRKIINCHTIGYDGHCPTMMSLHDVTDLQNKATKIFMEEGYIAAYAFLRKFLKAKGVPSIYSVQTLEFETFAEFASYIYLDPEANQYFSPETIAWFRNNVLN